MYTKYENKITKLLEEYIRLYLTYSKLNIEVIEITQFR